MPGIGEIQGVPARAMYGNTPDQEFSQQLGQFGNQLLRQALSEKDLANREAQRAEEARRWNIANARAEAEFKQKQDLLNKAQMEKQATNEALRAVVNPAEYQSGKLFGEKQAIEQSLANLSPADRVVAEQELKKNYDAATSGKQWLSNALNAQGVDYNVINTAKVNAYNQAVKTPGTPEYEAAKKAELSLYRDKLRAQHAYDKPVDNQVFFMDPKTGTGKWVKKGEDTGNLIPMDLYSKLVSSKGTTGKGDISSEKAITNIKTIIGSVGNPKDVESAYSDYMSIPGADPKEFYQELLARGGGNLSDKDWNDMWRKDLNLSDLKAKIAIAKKGKVVTPQPSGGTEVLPKPENKSEFSLFGITAPKTASTDFSGKRIIPTGDVDSKIRRDYDKLPSYAKKDISFSKYKENKNLFDRSYNIK